MNEFSEKLWVHVRFLGLCILGLLIVGFGSIESVRAKAFSNETVSVESSYGDFSEAEALYDNAWGACEALVAFHFDDLTRHTLGVNPKLREHYAREYAMGWAESGAPGSYYDAFTGCRDGLSYAVRRY